MQKSSAAVGLVLVSSALASIGFNAYQKATPDDSDYADSWNDDDPLSSASTRPSSGYHSSSYYHGNSLWMHDDGFHHYSSSSRNGSSFSHSSTSRGGFGSHGHSGGS